MSVERYRPMSEAATIFYDVKLDPSGPVSLQELINYYVGLERQRCAEIAKPKSKPKMRRGRWASGYDAASAASYHRAMDIYKRILTTD